jgi:repressor LexA
MVKANSASEAKLLAMLGRLEVENVPPPTIREVCKELGFKSTNAAAYLISKLMKAGKVNYEPKLSRSLKLATPLASGIPILGSVVAGFPEDTSGASEESIELDPAAFGILNAENAFALRVRGDSMEGRHFFEGDVVLFDRSTIPRHQDVVAALIDKECTLKTLVIEKGKAWLKAENPAYPDLIPTHELQIQGVAKALIRIPAA